MCLLNSPIHYPFISYLAAFRLPSTDNDTGLNLSKIPLHLLHDSDTSIICKLLKLSQPPRDSAAPSIFQMRCIVYCQMYDNVATSVTCTARKNHGGDRWLAAFDARGGSRPVQFRVAVNASGVGALR